MKNIFLLLLLTLLIFSCKNKRIIIYGDGIKDDTQNIQNIISSSKSGQITFPKNKRFRISNSISIPSNYSINWNNSTIIKDNLNIKFNAFVINNSKNIDIKNLNVTSINDKKISKTTTGINEFVIKIVNSSQINLEGLNISNCLYTILYIKDSNSIDITNCNFENIGKETNDLCPLYSYDCIFFGGYTSVKNINISFCTFKNIGISKEIKSQKSDADAIHFQSPQNGIISNINIFNCLFENISARGIKAQSGSKINIFNNTFNHCTKGVGISMANNIKDITIVKNYFNNCNAACDLNGKYICNNLILSNNRIENATYIIRTSGGSTFSNSKIINNYAKNTKTTFADIVVSNSIIKDNIIENFNTANSKSLHMAILIGNKSNNVHITNNTFKNKRQVSSVIYIQANTIKINVENNIIKVPFSNQNKHRLIHFSKKENSNIAINNKITNLN